jgi:hypothetical protein
MVRPVAAAAVLVLVILDYSHWPFRTTTLAVSPFYEQLARDPGDFAVAPFPADSGASKRHMYYQTIHGKRIVAGHVSREPADAARFLREHDLLRALLPRDPDLSEVADLSKDFGLMADLGIRYVVLQKDLMSAAAVERVKAFLSLRPAYEDEFVVVYRTDLVMGRDYSFDVSFTPTLGLVRGDVSLADNVQQGAFLGLDLLWGTTGEPGGEVALLVELVNEAGDVAQAKRMSIDRQLPTTEWPAGALRIGRYRMRVNARVPPGEYAVRLSVVDALSGERVGEAAQVAYREVEGAARSYENPAPQYRAGGCFGELLCVLGHDEHRQGGQLVLVLYWQAADLMEQDYVVSMRLVDPASGERVWQRDAPPGGWEYPTTWWDTGEVVSDTAECDVDGLSAGRYRLEVVIYEPRSGQALEVSVRSGSAGEGAGHPLALGEVDVP